MKGRQSLRYHSGRTALLRSVAPSRLPRTHARCQFFTFILSESTAFLPEILLQLGGTVIESGPNWGKNENRFCNYRYAVNSPPTGFCALGCSLFFGAKVAYSQSSLESDVDNARIIDMTHKGLGDDVIIARIKASATKFSLTDDDLAALKKAGVSDSVVAAMIQSTQLTSPKVMIDGNPVEVRTIGEQKVGGRLGHTVSLGIMSVKNKAYLQGQHASLIASRKPVVDIQLPPNDNIDNYIIVEMDERETEERSRWVPLAEPLEKRSASAPIELSEPPRLVLAAAVSRSRP